MPQVYSIAFVTRGAGAFAYSYSGPAGLNAGEMVAVLLRGRIELGLIVGVDSDPPQKELLPLIPVEVHRWTQLGRMLLDLCELSMSAPDELAGHLLFDTASKALRIELRVAAEKLSAAQVTLYGPLVGKLTPTQQKVLAKHWREVAELCTAGALAVGVIVAGDPASTRAPAAWRKHYRLDAGTSSLLGLPAVEGVWPGTFLAGLERMDFKQLVAAKQTEARFEASEPVDPALELDQIELPQEWQLQRDWPALTSLTCRRTFATWQQLRAAEGLLAELQHSLAQGQRVLVITPQQWLLDRLWPVLAPLAEHISRYRSESGTSIAGQILRKLDVAPHVTFGGPGAWKLAAYFPFDRIIVIDPTHPQYSAERTPHLDPRLALLLCAARSERTTLDLIEFGLSAIDGAMPDVQLSIHEPFEPVQLPSEPQPRQLEDTDPLPLELRQPEVRRLVYYNRLGSGRGLFCAECWAAVNCPRCGSSRINYTPAQSVYACPDCDLLERDLRCPRCHLLNLVAVLPGLESVRTRAGDVVLHGARQADGNIGARASVFGTSQLLESPAGFWPQQITYIHAEARSGLLSDWPRAVDMALRLHALYDNPELEATHIVSTRLMQQLGAEAGAAKVHQQYALELSLRELAGLPPYGTLYHLQLVASKLAALNDARKQLGEELQQIEGTTLLRLGTAYRQSGAHRLAGWLINPRITLREAQELRWRLHKLDVALTVHALRGPWVW